MININNHREVYNIGMNDENEVNILEVANSMANSIVDIIVNSVVNSIVNIIPHLL
tara:strand:- start:3 stop:167 length:165 start_codon:yes stop_codon:yes gene_type:complete